MRVVASSGGVAPSKNVVAVGGAVAVAGCAPVPSVVAVLVAPRAVAVVVAVALGGVAPSGGAFRFAQRCRESTFPIPERDAS